MIDSYDEFGYASGRGASAVGGLALAAVLLWLGFNAQGGTTWLIRFGDLLLLLGTVALLGGLIQGLLFLVERWLSVAERRRTIISLSPQARLIEAAGRLTADQIKVIPGMDYKSTEVDVLDTQDEMILYLVTPEGRIPLNWLRDYLNDCGVTWLRTIRSYSEGTPGYEFARAFTSWCVNRGYAFAAEGNRPAQWATEQVKSRLQRRFGLAGVDLDDAILRVEDETGGDYGHEIG